MNSVNKNSLKYCKKCLYNSYHPLGITFNNQGICSGCLVHEEKFQIDWRKKFSKLRKIVNKFQNKSYYDCVVPISGAKDSFFILHVVKKILGLNPLLVNYNIHHNTLRGLRNIATLRTTFDCDFIQKVVKPDKIKKINQISLDKLGSIYWHVLSGSTVFPVQIAVKYKIPLIIWGVHQGCDQVGMFSHHDEVEMTRKYRKNHDLLGYEAENFLNLTRSLRERDLKDFFYPSDKEILKVGVTGIYLSNYIKWDTNSQHKKMLRLYSYETFKQNRTFDLYNNVDCIHYNGLHDQLKLLKHGYSKITDHVNREIRFGRFTREEGQAIIHYYSNKKVKDKNSFIKYNNLTSSYLSEIFKKFRNSIFWEKCGNKWVLKNNSHKKKRTNIIEIEKRLGLVETKPKHKNKDLDYHLYDKSWY